MTMLQQHRIGKIDRIDQLFVRLPFVKPFSISSATWTCKETLLLRIESEGITAWGESVADPDPYYAYETTLTTEHIIRDFLLPLVQPDVTLGELEQKFRRVRGHMMAKATIENALVDLVAKREGVPLHTLLGQTARRIPSGISIGIQDTEEELIDAVEEAVASGYHRVKMKIRRGCDIDRVAAVRERFPNIALMADANGDYTLDDADHLHQLDAFNLTMIEQPLSYSDIYEHSLLQKKIATPLCLDESIHSLADARAAIDLGACKVINIKQGRVGGLGEAHRRILSITRRACVVRRDGRNGHWSRGEHPPANLADLHHPRRHIRNLALLQSRHRRAAGRARCGWIHCRPSGRRHRRADRRRRVAALHVRDEAAALKKNAAGPREPAASVAEWPVAEVAAQGFIQRDMLGNMATRQRATQFRDQ